MSNTLLLKRSSTANAVPLAANIALGELAINYTDGNLFYKNNSGTVTVIASNQFLSVIGNVTGGNVVTSGLVSAGGNVTGGNITTGGLITATGNIGSAGNISASYYIGNGSLLTGVIATGIGTLASLSVTGNIDTGNLRTAGLVTATGNIISAANVSGGNVISTALVQGATVSASGNVVGGNVNTAGIISATGNITSVGNVAGNFILGNGYFLTGVITSVANINLGNSNVTVTTSGGNIAVSVGGVANTVVFANTSTNFNTLVSASGNITGANLITGGLITATGNVQGGNVNTGGLVSATGNVIGGNINTGGLVSATGNITAVANIAGGNILTAGVMSSTGNAIHGNVNTGGLVSATGNVIGGNINTGGLVSATGNIIAAANVSGGNILTGGAVSATGNVTGGNVNTNNLVGTGLTLTSTGALNLQPSGNIVVNSKYINSVTDPVQAQDVATKNYVDNMVSSGLAYHTAVLAATTTTLAITTGGTITYTQPNGVANGVGAKLTTSTSFNLIDTANVQTVGTRILVKNEANAVWNGVYTWANATSIVRSTDTDEYGPDSSAQLSLNDYFFVTGGTTNEGSAWVVDSPTGTITFGTSNISFAQFSQSQVYEANASAGLSLVGTTFSAKVDNTTTAFDGSGNIIVKASANLTTPNIGAATGTSVSVTANITGGNVLTGGLVSATGNITSGNVNTAGLVTATGNITSAANVNGGNVVATTIVSAPSHIGSVVSVTANITGGNILTGGLISSTGNITSAANIQGGNLIGTIATASQTNITGLGTITTGTWNANVIGLAYGGTGKTTAPAAMAALMGYTSTATAAGTTTLTNTSSYYQQFTGTSTQTVVLPVTSTLQTGWTFHIVNNSTGNVTVQSSGLNNVIVIPPGTTAMVTCIGTALTTAADWESGITDFSTYTGTGDVVLATSPVLVTPNIGAATGTSVSVTANVTGGNINTAGLVTATGNVTGGNINTAGLITATGNIISAGNISGGNILATTAMYVGGVSVLTVNSTVDGGTY